MQKLRDIDQKAVDRVIKSGLSLRDRFKEQVNQAIQDYDNKWITRFRRWWASGDSQRHPRLKDIDALRKIVSESTYTEQLANNLIGYIDDPNQFRWAKLSPLRRYVRNAVDGFNKSIGLMSLSDIDTLMQLRTQEDMDDSEFEDTQSLATESQLDVDDSYSEEPDHLMQLTNQKRDLTRQIQLLQKQLEHARSESEQTVSALQQQLAEKDKVIASNQAMAANKVVATSDVLDSDVHAVNEELSKKKQQLAELESRLSENDKRIRELTEKNDQQSQLIHQQSDMIQSLRSLVTSLVEKINAFKQLSLTVISSITEMYKRSALLFRKSVVENPVAKSKKLTQKVTGLFKRKNKKANVAEKPDATEHYKNESADLRSGRGLRQQARKQIRAHEGEIYDLTVKGVDPETGKTSEAFMSEYLEQAMDVQFSLDSVETFCHQAGDYMVVDTTHQQHLEKAEQLQQLLDEERAKIKELQMQQAPVSDAVLQLQQENKALKSELTSQKKHFEQRLQEARVVAIEKVADDQPPPLPPFILNDQGKPSMGPVANQTIGAPPPPPANGAPPPPPPPPANGAPPPPPVALKVGRRAQAGSYGDLSSALSAVSLKKAAPSSSSDSGTHSGGTTLLDQLKEKRTLRKVDSKALEKARAQRSTQLDPFQAQLMAKFAAIRLNEEEEAAMATSDSEEEWSEDEKPRYN